ncbi:hypothetical protein WJX74_007073 [Apatococcus lobatus]|uniref:Protein kinase domain-containing protein n=1 Tax=Apatococcus lobatus TaxID=904363 RepID=A0AAW1RBS8_9CHLO
MDGVAWMERTRSRSFTQKGRTNSVDFTKLGQPRDPALEEKLRYPCDATAYELGQEIGKGASAVVYKATVKATQEVVALKLLNLEKFGSNLDIIIKETATMHDQRHPNVLPLFCSFVSGDSLWMVMPFLSGGSVMKLLHSVAAEGFDEVAVASMMKAALEGLNYMHIHGRIHRDIKAENILIDDAGKVMLADFGVAATLERSDSLASCSTPSGVLSTQPSLDSSSPTTVLGSSSSSSSLTSRNSLPRDPSWSHKQYLARNTFCGTPCFMAPEVMEQTIGYDFSADIWSFGITLYEVATGKAPLANMSLTQVILTTVHDEAPVLPNKNGRRYSDALQDLIGKCLSKDPQERPPAAELLRHRFWKIARDADYLQKNVLQPAAASNGGQPDKPQKFLDRVKSLRTMHSAGHNKPPSKAVSFPSGSQGGGSPARQGSGCQDATMSGDVANAIALLKKLTKVNTKKKHSKPFLPMTALQDAKGICFCIVHKKQNLCAVTGQGNGFMIAKQSAKNGKSASETSRRQWTAPCYFDINVGELNPDFEHDFVELAIVIPDDYAYDCFRVPAAKLGGRCVYTKGSKHCSEVIGYACVEGQCFEWPLDGSHITINDAANGRLFGRSIRADEVLDGGVRAPCEFEALYKLLSTMATPTQNRSEQALLHMEDQGATMLFRMPHWLYD